LHPIRAFARVIDQNHEALPMTSATENVISTGVDIRLLLARTLLP
jgi:hypothetical protein